MTRRSFVACVAALVASSASVFAQTPARVGVPVVRVSVDRTAVWVGDRVTYTMEFVCPKGTDVLEDDLAKDKIKLEGLDIVSTDTTRTEGTDLSVTRQFRYVLTTYNVTTPTLRVAPMTVRYYATRPGQRLQESAPAGEVAVPGTVIAFRSTLPEAQETMALRDDRPAVARPAIYSLAQPVGIGLVVVSIVPVAIAGLAFVARRRKRVRGQSVRKARRDERASLEAVKAIDVRTPEGRREVYSQIDGLVRDHLAHVAPVTGRALTPQEVEPALAGRKTRVSAEDIGALLAECERARYAPPAALPSEDQCRDALARAEQFLSR
ncbi:MAG TPA: hypothetical protein VF147_00225 [Vicinamibacterales bacterium]